MELSPYPLSKRRQLLISLHLAFQTPRLWRKIKLSIHKEANGKSPVYPPTHTATQTTDNNRRGLYYTRPLMSFSQTPGLQNILNLFITTLLSHFFLFVDMCSSDLSFVYSFILNVRLRKCHRGDTCDRGESLVDLSKPPTLSEVNA